MKLNLAQIQLLDILLAMISYKHESNKYKIVITSNSNLISFECFKQYSDITPIIHLDDIMSNEAFLSEKSALMIHSYEFYSNLSHNFIRTKNLLECPEMLLKYLFNEVIKYNDLEIAQKFVYDVDFILQDKHFDFYYLDDSNEYEVVSLIQPLQN